MRQNVPNATILLCRKGLTSNTAKTLPRWFRKGSSTNSSMSIYSTRHGRQHWRHWPKIDADLDKPTIGSIAQFAPTLGALFILQANHTMMHAGQFSVEVPQADKPVLF